MNLYLEKFFNVFFDTIEENLLKINSAQKNQILDYYELLTHWNSKINLIGRHEKNIIERHFLNSAAIASFRKLQPGERIIDLGSGGGFPAIILKILFPESFFLLVESIKKKSGFLNLVITRLKLENIAALNERAETLAQYEEYKNNFDLVTARALAPLTGLVPLARLFMKSGGEMLLLKGKRYENEIQLLKKNHKDANMSIAVCSLNDSRLFTENQEGVLLIIKNKS